MARVRVNGVTAVQQATQLVVTLRWSLAKEDRSGVGTEVTIAIPEKWQPLVHTWLKWLTRNTPLMAAIPVPYHRLYQVFKDILHTTPKATRKRAVQMLSSFVPFSQVGILTGHHTELVMQKNYNMNRQDGPTTRSQRDLSTHLL